jgi:hypothetical protein
MLGVGHFDGRPSETTVATAAPTQPPAPDTQVSLRERTDDRLNEAIETLAEAIALRKATSDAAAAPSTATDPPDPAQAAPAESPYREVRVPRGTTLRALVKEIYGEDNPDLISRIKDANPQIVNADRIIAGDTLRFPELSSARP